MQENGGSPVNLDGEAAEGALVVQVNVDLHAIAGQQDTGRDGARAEAGESDRVVPGTGAGTQNLGRGEELWRAGIGSGETVAGQQRIAGLGRSGCKELNGPAIVGEVLRRLLQHAVAVEGQAG